MLNASVPISAAPVAISHRRVILASSLGTGFEWYDFFLYGSLAAVISKQFFAGVNETSAFIFALLTFAAGFAVRPFGALLFGRLGDLVGRKKTFLATIIIMGTATTLVGVLPTYHSVGIAAPMTLIALRMLQGLAIGGEYGGAAIYVAEHAPPSLRGRYTSWIQTTATLALLLSLIVIVACRWALGPAFESWGWRSRSSSPSCCSPSRCTSACSSPNRRCFSKWLPRAPPPGRRSVMRSATATT